MSKEEKKNKISGVTGTILFHLFLFLLLFLFKFSVPLPEPEQEGITINFGTSDEGTGEIQPEQAVSTPSIPVQETVKPSEVVKTQNTEEAPVINQADKEIKEVKETPKEPERVVNPNALYKKPTASVTTNTQGEGETGKPGDQGSETGKPDATSHTGGGIGNKGFSFSLSGRKMVIKPSISDKSQETGRVVVDITVDRQGNVTKAVPGARGSTTSSTHLFSLAKQSALKTKFSSNPDGPEEQKGTITFMFLLE